MGGFFFLIVPLHNNIQAQDRPSIKWKVIQVSRIKIVYPQEYENRARILAHIIQSDLPYLSINKNLEVEPLTIFLDNRNSFANGYIMIPPKSGRFYHTPFSSSFFAPDWYTLLAIHELRHHIQENTIFAYDKSITRFNFARAWYYLGGESGKAAFMGLFIPLWFSEGDSVWTETSYTRMGRGRLPSFYRMTRAFLLSDKQYSFSEAYHGSYIKPLINHYELGYLMVSYAREKYHKDIWKTFFERLHTRSLLPWRIFNRSLKSSMDLNVNSLYYDSMTYLKKFWLSEDKKNMDHYDQHISLNKDKSIYTSYTHPRFSSEYNIICLKKGVNDHPSFVSLQNDGSETVLRTIPQQSTFISSGNHFIVWNEMVPHFRWNETRSIIQIYNIEKGDKKTLKSQNNLFFPAVSRNDNLLAVIEYSSTEQTLLKIYDLNNLKFIRQIELKEHGILISVQWSLNNQSILLVSQKEYNRVITLIDIKNSSTAELFSAEMTDLSNADLYNEQLFFHATYSGKDDIYLYNIQTRKLYQITNDRFGADFPSLAENGKQLLYSSYTAEGFDILAINLENLNKIEISNQIEKNRYPFYASLTEEDLFKYSVESKYTDSTESFESNNYSYVKNILYPHSWYIWNPLSTTANIQYMNPGVQSTDKLQTLNIDASVSKEKWATSLAFSRWYPLFYFQSGSGKRVEILKENNQTIDVQYKYFYSDGYTTIPALITKGLWSFYLETGGGISYNKLYNITLANNPWPDEVSTVPLVIFSQSIKKSGNLNIFQNSPMFQEYFSLLYYHSSTEALRNKMAYALKVIFPGFYYRHIFLLQGVYSQKMIEVPGTVEYNAPRGYLPEFDSNGVFLFTYYAPLFYPDTEILFSTLYVNLINLGIIYDHGFIFAGNKKGKEEISTGAELLMETTLVNTPITFNIGVDYLYLIPEKLKVINIVAKMSYFFYLN